MVIYISTEKYKYMVITESDIILQKYYITRKYKSMIYKEIYITKEVLRYSKSGLGSQSEEEQGGRATATSKLLLRSDHHGRSAAHSISYSKATKVRALESGYENPGLSDATPRVHMMKPSGMLIRRTCT